MIPFIIGTVAFVMGAPRTCGDDPTIAGINAQVQQCSPHMRG